MGLMGGPGTVRTALDAPVPSAVDLARRLDLGETTSVELVRRALAGAEASGAVFITLADDALRAAAASDARRAAGAPLSAIDGIPTAVKDVIDTAGLRTTMASEFFRDFVPERDAEVVADLRAAGCVIIGKTNAQEFSYGIRGDAGAFGAVPNPHDPSRVAGGSSSGSAAAVALGIVPFAVGSDTAGSVRVPAALCGVAGLKPSLGLIDTSGAFPLSESFDTLGLLATSAEDLELVMRELDLIRGERAPAEPEFLALDELRSRVQDPAAGQPFDAAVELLGAGSVRLPLLDGAEVDYEELYRIVRSREAYLLHADRVREAPEKFQPAVLRNVLSGRDVRDSEVTAAQGLIARAREAMGAAFRPGQLLLSPTTPILAPPLGDSSSSGPLAALTVIWNVLGWPAISVPVRVEGCPLPQSLQVIGTPGDDLAVLRGAQRIERAFAGEGERSAQAS